MNIFNSFISAIPLIYGALFPVLNPLGTAFIIIALTRSLDSASRRSLAYKISMNTFVLLTLVLWIGEWFMQVFGITVGIVQVAGGLVVAYIGWHTMNQPGDTDSANSKAIKNNEDAGKQAFFPLTMPITAGPGSIAVALTIGAHENGPDLTLSLVSKLGATTGILLSAITVYFCYAYSDVITKKLGPSMTTVIIKLSAFIIFCIGLTIFWHGMQEVWVSNPLGG